MKDGDVIRGRTLHESDPEIFDEFAGLLQYGSMSHAAVVLSDEERAVVLARLREAKIAERCGCKQDDCRSYIFQDDEHSVGRPFTIRFHVSGEAMMDVYETGGVRFVERLVELDSRPRVVYAVQPNGEWAVVHTTGEPDDVDDAD